MRAVTRTTRPIVERDLKGAISIFDADTRKVTVLNATASDVWRLTAEPSTIAEITARIARAYGVDPTDIGDQVDRALYLLADAGLVDIPEATDD